MIEIINFPSFIRSSVRRFISFYFISFFPIFVPILFVILLVFSDKRTICVVLSFYSIVVYEYINNKWFCAGICSKFYISCFISFGRACIHQSVWQRRGRFAVQLSDELYRFHLFDIRAKWHTEQVTHKWKSKNFSDQPKLCLTLLRFRYPVANNSFSSFAAMVFVALVLLTFRVCKLFLTKSQGIFAKCNHKCESDCEPALPFQRRKKM